MSRQKRLYFADFETTQPNDNQQVFVYLWCVVGEKSYTNWGRDIKSFIDLTSSVNGIFYFHNLKFDSSYVRDYLTRSGYHYDILEKKGTIYSIKYGKCELRDTMNFFPNMSVEAVAKAYNKNAYKYHLESYDQKEGHIATEEEIRYCFNDCNVIKEAYLTYMKALTDVLNEANCPVTVSKLRKKLTNAGIAFEAFKELSDFDAACPKTSYAEYKAFVPAYKGGYVYSNPRGIVEDIMMIDCNSMYPFIYSSIEMPYGHPINLKKNELDKYKFYILKCEIRYDLKEGYIPIIGGGVGKYGGVEYKSSSNGEYEEITVCSIDLELIKEFYDCDIIFQWAFGFRTKANFYKTYADTFIRMKNTYKSGDPRRNIAKVLLNSPYGKTAMNGLNEIRKDYIDDNDILATKVTGYEIDDASFQYLPQAIAITAGARRLLLTTGAKIGFKHIHYMDTDSIKFDHSVKLPFECDPNTLGAWKNEGIVPYFKTIACKKYVYLDEDSVLHYTCAGFNKSTLTKYMKHDEKVTLSEAMDYMKRFDKGLELPCNQSKKLSGGRAILPIMKEIR